MTDAWLFGGTGHAFVTNVHEGLCPSGPTAWKTMGMFELAKNLGYELDGLFALKTDPEFAAIQEQAFEHVRASIDEGRPCYGWELAVPEYYVINGYDDVGYYISGPCPEPVTQPKPWREVGDTQIGVLEIYSVKPSEPADDATAVREALTFALEHATSPEKWIFPKYRAGPEAFDLWVNALETNTADGFGISYNSEVWAECRRHAVEFLKQARERLPDRLAPLLGEAVGHYDVVARELEYVENLYPFHTRKPAHIESEVRRLEAAKALRAAREAEAAGLGVLERIVGEI
jgi:hypothetical protein